MYAIRSYYAYDYPKTNRQLYDSLLQRYKEIGVAGNVQDNNIAIINRPKLADRPVSPRLLVNLLVAIRNNFV